MDLGSFLADILVDIDQIGPFFFFFAFFSQAAFITDFVSDIWVIYRYIGNISPILGDFFRFFQQTTFICKNRIGKTRHPKYRRYIDNILTICHDISVRA